MIVSSVISASTSFSIEMYPVEKIYYDDAIRYLQRIYGYLITDVCS